jgi:hypothetical protein
MNRIDFLQKVKTYLPLNPVCVEIGVHEGFFAKNIYDILNPSKLYLIDPWTISADKNSPQPTYQGELMDLNTAYSTNDNLLQVKQTFQNQIIDHKVIIQKNFSYDAVDNFVNEYFDFVYIDATHIYECVKADLNMYFPKLKKKGLMCGHDYIYHTSFSVIQAVDEFISQNNGNIILKSNEGDFAIQFNKNHLTTQELVI